MTALGAFELILLLLTAAVLLALIAQRLHTPPAVAFVLGGMLLAVTPGVRALELDPELYLALFLPPLVQSSAFFTVWGVVRNRTFLGYTDARKPPARDGRISVRRVSCGGGGDPPRRQPRRS